MMPLENLVEKDAIEKASQSEAQENPGDRGETTSIFSFRSSHIVTSCCKLKTANRTAWMAAFLFYRKKTINSGTRYSVCILPQPLFDEKTCPSIMAGASFFHE
jgi:hypothetical protein